MGPTVEFLTPEKSISGGSNKWPLNIKGAQIYGRRIMGKTELRGSRFRRVSVFLPRGNRRSGSHAPM